MAQAPGQTVDLGVYDRFHVHAQMEHLQTKYHGTGGADTTKWEWATNIHRDTMASHVGHYTRLAYFALCENEPVARVELGKPHGAGRAGRGGQRGVGSRGREKVASRALQGFARTRAASMSFRGASQRGASREFVGFRVASCGLVGLRMASRGFAPLSSASPGFLGLAGLLGASWGVERLLADSPCFAGRGGALCGFLEFRQAPQGFVGASWACGASGGLPASLAAPPPHPFPAPTPLIRPLRGRAHGPGRACEAGGGWSALGVQVPGHSPAPVKAQPWRAHLEELGLASSAVRSRLELGIGMEASDRLPTEACRIRRKSPDALGIFANPQEAARMPHGAARSPAKLCEPRQALSACPRIPPRPAGGREPAVAVHRSAGSSETGNRADPRRAPTSMLPRIVRAGGGRWPPRMGTQRWTGNVRRHGGARELGNSG